MVGPWSPSAEARKVAWNPSCRKEPPSDPGRPRAPSAQAGPRGPPAGYCLPRDRAHAAAGPAPPAPLPAPPACLRDLLVFTDASSRGPGPSVLPAWSSPAGEGGSVPPLPFTPSPSPTGPAAAAGGDGALVGTQGCLSPREGSFLRQLSAHLCPGPGPAPPVSGGRRGLAAAQLPSGPAGLRMWWRA